MKETERRRGPNNKVKNHPARPDTRDRRVQAKNGGRNLKAKEIDSKPSSDKQNVNTLARELKTGAEPPEDFENMVMDYVDDAKKSEETLNDTRTLTVDEKHSNENFVNNSSNMGIPDESDAETANDSISSQGDLQTGDEEKAEKVTRVPNKFAKNSSDGYYPAAGSKSESKINNPQIKASKNTPNKGAKPEKGISMSTAKSSSDNFKNMKVHPKPQSDTWEGTGGHPLEQVEGIDFLDEASNDAYSETSHDEAVDTVETNKQEDRGTLDQKIEEMEAKIESLQGELREVAALEIALYSVVPEHSSSAHKVHRPARRLSRLYIYACKYWSQNKRATVARNTVSGLVLVSKSCGNDVSRLTFWLSNAVVLREIISQAFGSSCHSSALAKAFESSGCETRFSPLKWNNTSGCRQLNNRGLLKFVDDWQETGTFTAALEKVESWIFSRIVESIWWQTLTPNMLSSVGDSITNKDAGKLLGPALGDQKQRNFSINLWRNAFHDALKRLCPVQAGRHECGCLPVLTRKAMEQCIGRLDVAMFNAILRESVHEIPTDPVSDPIVDSEVLPIPAGDLSFGSGAQLKNSVGNWARWLSEFLGKDADSLETDKTKSQDGDDEIGTEEPKCFPLLNALSDLLMLPKDMLMDRTIRMEVCPQISLPLVKRVLCNFSPDEFCPDPVPGAVLEALNIECIIERRSSGDSNSNFPYTAAPVVYTPPSPSDVAERVPDGRASSPSSRSASAQKGYTSDEELDELESCLSCKLPPSPTAVVKGNVNEETGDDRGRNARYGLLREVWQAT